MLLRPGNAGSNTFTDHEQMLAAVLRQVPARFRRKILRTARSPESRAVAGCLASLAYVRARGATVRRDHITLHLPDGWHREDEWTSLFEAACGPPAAAA